MAELAFGALAAGVGSQFGYAQLGWMVGSALYSYVNAPEIVNEGPRISDIKVQSSQWGIMITKLIGTHKVAGNLIWMAPLREVRIEQHQSTGKGGGSVTTVTFQYFQSFAVGICEGLITDVHKVFANGELIYDKSLVVPPAVINGVPVVQGPHAFLDETIDVYCDALSSITLYAGNYITITTVSSEGYYETYTYKVVVDVAVGPSSTGTITINTGGLNIALSGGEAIIIGTGPAPNKIDMVVYPGDELQAPDPLIESVLGAGNVPAYRGLAYVVINDMDITAYRGSMPNLEFEVERSI